MSRRIAPFLALCAVTAGTVALAGPSSSSASGGSPTIELRSQGQPVQAAASGVAATSTVNGPVAASGSIPVELVSSWDPTVAPISAASDVVAPDGFTLSYSTDGSTFGAAPGNFATVRSVKAVGTVQSDGLDGTVQKYSYSGAATVRPALGSFQGSSGGDGWDVFIGLNRVFNIYHHDTVKLGLDCHERTTGAYCWTFPAENNRQGAFFVNGYTTGARSTGYVHESTSRVWALVKRNSDNGVGFLCVDVSGSLPSVCAGVGVSGFVSLGTTALVDYDGLTDMVVYGSKLYTKTNDANSQILCLDLVTAAPCQGQPYTPAQGYTSPSGTYQAGRIKGFLGKIYISSSTTQFDCFDIATLARCVASQGGSWPKTGGTFAYPIFAVTSNGGSTINAVCTHQNTCVTPGGAAYTYPVGLPATSDSATAGWGDNYNLGDKYYYNAGGNTFGCWNFATGAACAGYTPTTLGGYVYALTVDPVDSNCLWSNSNDGTIKPFNATTGQAGCTPPNGTVDFLPANFARRMSCASSDRVTAWTSLSVTPANGLQASDARLTVLNAGTAVAGWTAVQPGQGGVFDLSTLTTQLSGATPTFAVEFLGSTANTVAGTTGVLKFRGGVPQLCVNITPQAACSSGDGQSAVASVPGAAVVTSGVVKTGSGQSQTVTNLSLTTPSAGNSACLGTLSGTLTNVTTSSGVSGAVVSLISRDSSQLIEVTSAANGTYSMPRLWPGTYVVVYGAVGSLAPQSPVGTVTITANAVTTQNVNYDGSSLVAPPVVGIARPFQFARIRLVPIGGSGPLDSTLTRFVNPTNGTLVNQLNFNSGLAWSLAALDSLEAGAPSFVGTYHSIYRIGTTGGSRAYGIATLIVLNTASQSTTSTTTPPSTTIVRPTVPGATVPAAPVPAPNGSLPAIPLGESLATENGVPLPVVVEEVADGQWQMTGPDFQWDLEIPAGDTPGSANGVVTLVSNRDVEVGGHGFMANSLVDVWLMSTPIFLGTVRVRADGTFEGSLKVPAGIEPGRHTLQANGVTPDMATRSLNLGVQVLAGKPRLPITGSDPSGVASIALLVLGLGVVAIMGRRLRRI